MHVVAARLGHADPAITLRVYAHVLREQAAGVAEVFAHAVASSALSAGVSKDVSKTITEPASRSVIRPLSCSYREPTRGLEPLTARLQDQYGPCRAMSISPPDPVNMQVQGPFHRAETRLRDS